MGMDGYLGPPEAGRDREVKKGARKGEIQDTDTACCIFHARLTSVHAGIASNKLSSSKIYHSTTPNLHAYARKSFFSTPFFSTPFRNNAPLPVPPPT
ncbi:hypothetical protein Purlil1_6748 [Purpureocillium lilacinum]|uniref:Uncharacterized protein n=1 Tax=Purpureocillium lilacinum TaxID=33203 RepID=A0ABR0BY44_PURLI|nr:hypothetical protein Purlil1_6748 [Purpureocillium lilacinum]